MSGMSTGQIVGGVVGAVIGFYAGGNVALGWTAGVAIGGVIDPQRIDGPRLQDRKVQVSTYGASIPIIYGGDAGAGNIIWSSDLVEHDVESDGKGGPVVTNHTYSVSCAILVGEGPIAGIRRIWADAKLVYDVSVGASESTQVASNLFAANFTFYSGSEAQLPDPTMEAALGVGNVPAYRGSCYIVFHDMPLQDYGNRIPNIRVETSEAPSGGSIPAAVTYEPLTVGPWTGGNAPAHSYADTEYRETITLTNLGTNLAAAAAANAALYSGGANYSVNPLGYWVTGNTLNSRFAGGSDVAGDPQYVYYGMACQEPDVLVDLGGAYLMCSPIQMAGATVDDGLVYWSRDNAVSTNPDHIGKLVAYPATFTAQFSAIVNNCINYPATPNFPQIIGNKIIQLRAERLPGPPPDTVGCIPGDPCLLGSAQLPADPNYCINCAGDITPRVSITYTVVTGTYRQLVGVVYAGGVLVQNALGPVVPLGDPRYADGAFWAAAAASAIANGTLNATYYYGGPTNVTSVARGDSSAFPYTVAEEANTTLDVIVADLWARAGGNPAQCDVSALAAIPVQGFSVARQMPMRAAIVPLQQTFWWDFVESGSAVKAVLRGGASAATITVDDLGASEATEAVVAVVPNRAQEAELPATLTVTYPVRATGYEAGTQRARRVVTGSKQLVSTEVAVVMTDTQGAKVADVNMYATWTNRTARTWSTTRKWADLEPTDVVTLDDGEFSVVVRITGRSEEGGVINWQGVDERPATYSPNVSAASGSGSVIGGVRYDGPMKLELIDCPIVSDSNNDPGFYAAASGYVPTWPSGAAFKSIDGGATYAKAQSMVVKATIGYATTALGGWSGGNSVDEANTVNVRLHNGTLSSISRESLLSNGNAAILGDELIQFQRVEVLDATTVRLSGLLRGRKGTEQHMATHAANERFVLFTSNVYRMADEVDDLNVAALWKGVTSGQSLDAASPQSFTNTGAGMKPLAPTHLYAVDIGGGQRSVSFVRRTRIGGKWRDGADVPLGEASESYVVEVLTGAVVNSSVTVSASPVVVTATVGQTVRVQQLSSTVGRGFPAAVQL